MHKEPACNVPALIFRTTTAGFGTFTAVLTTNNMKRIRNNSLKLFVCLALAGIYITANAQAAEEYTWEPKGTAVFTETLFSSFNDLPWEEELEVAVEEAAELPGLYRLVNPYANWSAVTDGTVGYDGKDHFFVIHTENPGMIWAEGTDTGVIYNGSKMEIKSNVEYYVTTYGEDFLVENLPACSGDFENGVISFPASFVNGYDTYLFALVPAGNPSNAMAANGMGHLKIKLPDAAENDYSLNVQATRCITDGKIRVTVTSGQHVDEVRVRVAPELRTGQESYFTKTQNEGVVIADGETYTMDIESDRNAYTISVTGTNSDRKRKNEYLTWALVQTEDNDNQWIPRGKGTLTDPFLPIFQYADPDMAFEVEIEENVDNPNYFRIVNPYACHPVAGDTGTGCDGDHNHYIYIDATNPEGVSVPLSNSGIDMGDGMVFVWSIIDSYGMTAETLIQYGYELATYDAESRTINFPPNTLTAHVGGRCFMMQYNNLKSGKLVLPGNVGIDSITDSDTQTEWYDMTGIRVAKPSKGMYIRRQDGSSKVVIL